MQKPSFSSAFTPVREPQHLIATDGHPVPLPSTQVKHLHYHDRCEVGICRSGNGLWFVKGQAYALSPGDTVFIPPHLPHYSRSIQRKQEPGCDTNGSCECEFIYFDAQALFAACGIAQADWQRTLDQVLPVFTTRTHGELCMLLQRMINAALSDGDELHRARLAAHWFSLFLLMLPDAPAAPHLPQSELTPAIERMLLDFTEPLTLQSLADACAISPSWFLKRFRQEYGTTPMQYLHELRVEIAAQLLLGSPMSIMDVCMFVGYSSPSELYRHFKARYAMSPSQYRRLVNG